MNQGAHSHTKWYLFYTHTHAFSFQHTQADTRSHAHTVMRERTCTHHIPQTTNGRGEGMKRGDKWSIRTAGLEETGCDVDCAVGPFEK